MRLTKKVREALKIAAMHVNAIGQSMDSDEGDYSKEQAQLLFIASDYISSIAYREPRRKKSNESKVEVKP